jgi:hypothetical protein
MLVEEHPAAETLHVIAVEVVGDQRSDGAAGPTRASVGAALGFTPIPAGGAVLVPEVLDDQVESLLGIHG